MPHLKKEIIIGDRLIVFHFIAIKFREELRYFVTAFIRRETIFFFTMKKSINGKWKVNEEDMPVWLIGLEPRLSDYIMKHHSC